MRNLYLFCALVAVCLDFILPVSSASTKASELGGITHLASFQERYQLQFESQDLTESIRDLSRLTEWIIDFDERLIRNQTAPELKGEYSLIEALDLLFADSGLVYNFVGGRRIRITRRSLSGEVGGRQLAPNLDGDHIVVTGNRSGRPIDYRSFSTSVATKSDVPVLEIPQNVSIFERTMMDDMILTTISQAHEYAVGMIQMRDDGPGFSRGFNLGWYDFRRDGLRTYTWSIREPFLLERIQYLKGPASVLYGEGSPGGMVNLVSKQPLANDRYELGTTIGSYGLYRVQADLTGPLSADRSLSYRLPMVYETFDSLNQNDETRAVLMPSIAWSPRQDLTVTTDIEFYYEKQRGMANAVAPDLDTNRVRREFNAADPSDQWWNYNVSPGLRLDWQFHDDWSWHSAARVVYIKADNDYHRATGFDSETEVVERQRGRGTYDWWEYQTDSFFDGRWQTGPIEHKLVVGLELSRSTEKGWWVDADAPAVNYRNPEYVKAERPEKIASSGGQVDRAGIYLQNMTYWSQKWISLLAARYDEVLLVHKAAEGHHEKVRHKASSPRIGLVYKANPDLAFFSSISDSFQAPWSGAYLEDGSRPDPVITRSYEIGLKSDFWDQRLSISSALFLMSRQGELQWLRDNLYNQVGEAESRGLELEIDGRFLEPWLIRLSYAYLDTEITKDEDNQGHKLPYAPEHNISIWNRYNLNPHWGLGLGYVYVDGRYNNNANELKFAAFRRWDASLYFQAKADRGLRASLLLQNLGDEDYVRGGWSPWNIVPAPRRSGRFQLTYIW